MNYQKNYQIQEFGKYQDKMPTIIKKLQKGTIINIRRGKKTFGKFVKYKPKKKYKDGQIWEVSDLLK